MAFDVAAVDGGLSGMTAARDLKRSGLSNFAVLEARDLDGAVRAGRQAALTACVHSPSRVPLARRPGRRAKPRHHP